MRSSPQSSTIAELLSEHARERGSKVFCTILPDGGQEGPSITYADLDAAARALAARLLAACAPGDRALILESDIADFVVAFMACQRAGVVAVPLATPTPIGSASRVATLRAIARDCAATVVLTGGRGELRAQVTRFAPEIAALHWIVIGSTGGTIGTAPDPPREAARVRPDDLAFLQYTSGSTSTPKGVMVTHEALLRNARLQADGMRLDADDVVVSWLPLFHDMGLIGKVLQTFYLGARAVLMPPMTFVQRPSRWLAAITRHGGTVAGAPNFGFDLCVRRVYPQERAELDLSSWRVAFSGAEPVRPATLDAFVDAYRPHGFEARALFAAYGLAENTLITTVSAAGTRPRTLRVDRAELAAGRLAPGGSQEIVGVGIPAPERRLEIVDPDTCRRCPPGSVGEVWAGGPDVAAGYWGRPEESALTFAARIAPDDDGPFLRTGDLGVLHDGELFITGRLKDLVIVGGRNHYPQDLEATVEAAHPWIRGIGGCAAFAVDRDDGERLVIVSEVSRPTEAWAADAPDAVPSSAEIDRAVRSAISVEHGIAVDDLVLVAPGAVPRTSSGKVRRRACRAAYEAGGLRPAPLSLAGPAHEAGPAQEHEPVREGVE